MKQLKVIPLHVCSQLFKNYSYIVFNQESKNALIIDPAWELEKYLETLNDFGVTPTHILLTHTHFDHIGLVDYFAVNFKTKVWVSKNERSRLPLASDFIRTFSHMEVLRLNRLECKAFLTPGHSPGSSCFLIGSNLFSGDTLFIEGCGICDDPDANPGHLYESLMFIKNEFPLSVKVYPGHRFQAYPGKSMEYVLANNIYMHFKEKSEFVDFRMRNNKLNCFDFK